MTVVSKFSANYFSDKYVIDRQSLNYFKYGACTQTGSNLLLRKRETCAVVFWGVLVKYSATDPFRNNLETNRCSFRDYVPIFDQFYFDNVRFKLYADCYCSRIGKVSSCLSKYRKRSKLNVNLDEITPVEDDCGSDILNFRSHLTIDDTKLNIEIKSIVLEPLLLENLQKKRIMHRIMENEEKKVIRVTILYVLAFFALAIATFFIIYLA